MKYEQIKSLQLICIWTLVLVVFLVGLQFCGESDYAKYVKRTEVKACLDRETKICSDNYLKHLERIEKRMKLYPLLPDDIKEAFNLSNPIWQKFEPTKCDYNELKKQCENMVEQTWDNL